MADNINENQDVVTEQQEVKAELDKMMGLSLSVGKPVEQKNEVIDSGGVVDTGGVVDDKPVSQTEPPVFQFQTFTDKFGWQNPEDAAKEIEELRSLKANPVKEAIKYENDKSEQLASALQKGEFEKVHKLLDEQIRIDKYLTGEVTEQTADEIIKLGLRISHADLTDKEIAFKFNKMYGFPKEPNEEDFTLATDYEKAKLEWAEQVEDIKTSKIIDAKLVKPQLETAKTKLVLPVDEPSVDEGYIQYQKELEQADKLAEEAATEYKTFNPKSIEAKMNFNDEANKIQFDFQFEPDEQSFKIALEAVTNPEKYRERYQNSDGSYNRKRFLEDVYFSMNREKVLMEAMKQAKNATIKSMLPDNSSGGFNRQIPQGQEMSELDKMMQASGVKR